MKLKIIFIILLFTNIALAENFKFNKITKPNQKLNLFIIRKKGMVREIIENILNQIENEYQILDKILININNKKKFYSNFYGNYDKHKDDIEKK